MLRAGSHRSSKGAVRGTNQVDPVLRMLAVRLAEVVSSAHAWVAPEEASALPLVAEGDAGP
ncbi:hypothetical protein ACWD04_32385 [Streptomyces sp. NPDC002911]